MSRVVALGPAGTGKTRFGQSVVSAAIRRGIPLDKIAFVAFNREAAYTAAYRCGIEPEERRDLWFRTLHSMCYKLLGDKESRPGVLTPALRRKFSEESGIEIESGKDDPENSVEDMYWDAFRVIERPKRDGDKYLNAYNRSRLRCRTADELEEAEQSQHPDTLSIDSLDPWAYHAFVSGYEKFKRREGVVDYIDMLARVVKGECKTLPHFKIAIIDESQDLGGLLWSAAERLLFDADDLFLVGDDWQCIYAFQMAKATDFLAYREGAKVLVLQQTYRFGQEIVDLAAKVTNRLTEQHRKNVIPKPGVQHKISSTYEFNPEEIALARGDGTAMILHRHIAGCREIGDRFIRAGIPFWNERGVNPLARSNDRRAYLAFKNAERNGVLDYMDLIYILDAIPSRKMTPEGMIQLVKHGAKKRIREIGVRADRVYKLEELGSVFSDQFLSSVKAGDMSWMDIQYADYYEALSKKGFDLVKDDPKIVITTIHGAKGREADFVGLFTETFPKLLENEDEHRVGYVGVTRTRKDLMVIHEPIVGDWTQEYPYPL